MVDWVLLDTPTPGAPNGGDSWSLPVFQRGDSNADCSVDITDGVYTLNALFSGGRQPPCLDAADTNDDGVLNVTDSVALSPGGLKLAIGTVLIF